MHAWSVADFTRNSPAEAATSEMYQKAERTRHSVQLTVAALHRLHFLNCSSVKHACIESDGDIHLLRLFSLRVEHSIHPDVFPSSQ
jgi:hypothetical protein